ncbi:MAG TPA: hypothetical protein VG649_12750 [Candidatus Angelobacter sp.]|nr:hypothetical protein [Candidatus Angelobacter sp.]
MTKTLKVTALKISGLACKILGMIACVVGSYFFMLTRKLVIIGPDWLDWIPDRDLAALVTYGLTIFLFVFGIFLFWLGQQSKTLAMAKTIDDASQPTLLYLRLFKADPSLRKQVFGQLISLVFPGARYGSLLTPEEQLAAALRPVGNLITLGRPGEHLPRPGAAPLYASDAEWKEAVRSHLRTARLVILRAGSSTSLLWELEQAMRIVPPEQLLILLFRLRKHQYQEFRAAANKVFEAAHGISLPDLRVPVPMRLSGFIMFSKDWNPSFTALEDIPILRRGTFNAYRKMFKFALRPVFEKLGVKWKAPPISVAAVGSIAFLALIAFQILRSLMGK